VPDFQHRQRIAAPPDRVYALVADVANLPKYVPTTKAAQAVPGGKVRLQGKPQGHRYDSDGYFRADAASRRIEWGAEERDYSGFLDVEDAGDGRSDLTVHLSFSDQMPQRVEAEQQAKQQDAPPAGGGPSGPQIQEGLEASLRSIQNLVEGRGGKEEPASAQPTG